MSKLNRRQGLSFSPKSLGLLLPPSIRDLIEAATDLLRLISSGLRRLQQPKGLYEVLSYTASVELLDSQGKKAIYRKQEKIRFLQDCSTGFYDYGWGDGRAFASHRVVPGRIENRKALGPRYRSLITLPSPKRRGETFSFSVRRLVQKGFLRPEHCWLEAEVNHRMERLSLAVIIPTQRLARAARVLRHRQPTRIPISVAHRLSDGRQILRYSVRKPDEGELYTLEWDW